VIRPKKVTIRPGETVGANFDGFPASEEISTGKKAAFSNPDSRIRGTPVIYIKPAVLPHDRACPDLNPMDACELTTRVNMDPGKSAGKEPPPP